MDLELRKAEVQHRFLQIKQTRSFNFFWASLIYCIIITIITWFLLIEFGVSKKIIFVVSFILWLITYVRMIIRERTFLENLRRKMFEKKEEEPVEVVDLE